MQDHSTHISAKSSALKYEELAQSLRDQIRHGVLRPGDRLPTLTAMRATENVSRPTVEKAYSLLEAEGLIERRHSTSAVVALPRKAAAGVLGLCGFEGTGSSAFWTDLVEGIRHSAQATGAQVLLLPYHVGEGWEKVDGVLLCDWLNAYYPQTIPSQLPVVSLFVAQKQWRHSSVIADEYSGICQAVNHLLNLGHQRIAYLHGRDVGSIQPRLQAYRDSLKKAGIAVQKNWCRVLQGKNDLGPEFIAAGRSEMLAWLGEKGANNWKKIGCSALLCHNDEVAIGAMQALQESGLNIPRDVSVIGFDGTAVGEYSSPRLTSIELPLRRMGAQAVEVLQRQIEADDVLVESCVLPTRLIIRQSTAPRP